MKIENIHTPVRVAKRAIYATTVLPYKAVKVAANKLTQDTFREVLPGIILMAEGFTPQGKINHGTRIHDSIITARPAMPNKDVFIKEPAPAPSKAKITPTTPVYSEKLLFDYQAPSEDLDSLISKLLEPKRFQKTKNPLFNKGKQFIEISQRHGVDPRVIIAIAMQESDRGISKAAINKNNIGGMTGKNGLIKYERLEDCIEAMARVLERHTKKNKIFTIEELGNSGKYCDKSVSKLWIKNVRYYLRRLT